jgi:endonuclease-3
MSNIDIISELTKYNGIGVKTASCVLLFSLRKNVCPVDTHVHRTTNRIGIADTGAPDKTFILLNENMPDDIAHSFHTNLIRLGREICKPANPNCSICPLLKICNYENKILNAASKYKENNFLLLDSIK